MAFSIQSSAAELKFFVAFEVKRRLTSLQSKSARSELNGTFFGQRFLLSIEHSVDLEVTLSFPLGPVPWSLTAAHGL